MKILYIDCVSSFGHTNFNRIHINTLLELKHDVYCVFRIHYHNQVATFKAKNCLEIPDNLYLREGLKYGRFKYRFKSILQLYYIKKNIIFSNYDIVVFSSYDPISLFFLKIRRKTFIFDHNNIAQLNNPIKKWFTCHLPSNYTHLVFNEDMRQGLSLNGIKNCYIIPHGFVVPFKIVCHSIRENFNIPLDKKLIFCPSITSVDTEYINMILNNIDFLAFLKKYQCCLILMGNYINKNKTESIIIITNFLSENEYRSLFLFSHAIFLPYKNDFKYRVSNILFESIINNKPLIMADIDSLRVYQQYFNYTPYYKNMDQLKTRIHDILEQENNSALYKQQYEDENPITAWNKLLNHFKI